ncbi:MAG TPA: hypothetical protein VIX19_11360 [Terriglobales bacterium]
MDHGETTKGYYVEIDAGKMGGKDKALLEIKNEGSANDAAT